MKNHRIPRVRCGKCGELMRLDDKDDFRTRYPTYWFMCDCGCSCIVQNGKILAWSDGEGHREGYGE